MPSEKAGCCCPFAAPGLAARKLSEIANGVEAVQDGRIYIERVNAPFLVQYQHDQKPSK